MVLSPLCVFVSSDVSGSVVPCLAMKISCAHRERRLRNKRGKRGEKKREERRKTKLERRKKKRRRKKRRRTRSGRIRGRGDRESVRETTRERAHESTRSVRALLCSRRALGVSCVVSFVSRCRCAVAQPRTHPSLRLLRRGDSQRPPTLTTTRSSRLEIPERCRSPSRR